MNYSTASYYLYGPLEYIVMRNMSNDMVLSKLVIKILVFKV